MSIALVCTIMFEDRLVCGGEQQVGMHLAEVRSTVDAGHRL